MGIFLYKKVQACKDREVVERYRKIAFGGNKNGVIYKYLTVRNVLNEKNRIEPAYHNDLGAEPYIQWDASATEVIEAAGYSNSEQFRLIIDLKPSVRNNVSLYEILHIWGITYKKWTPLLLKLRAIFTDEEVEENSIDKCKSKFILGTNENTDAPVFDFIYLQGGYETGSWNPARLGFYSGVLWWPEAASFFGEKMRKVLKSWNPTTNKLMHKLICKTKT